MQVNKELDIVLAEPGKCVQCGRPVPKSAAAPVCKKCDVRLQPPVSEQEAIHELARQEIAMRELSRRRFLPFVQRLNPEYLAGWFHQDLAARIERFVHRVEREESPRMIINVPPRRGKSEQASKALPAWFLGRNPSKAIIATTHSDDLAFDNSRDVLRYIKDEKYQSVFPGVALNKDNQGATGWRTTEGGVYKPAGVGKGIAGRGAHIFLIDDPHKDKEAYSEAVRNAIWRWYKSSARTRLMPGGGIIIIQTRWVLDDLTGRVLAEEGKIEDGGIWEHIVYPEEAVQDEYRLPSGIIVNYPAPRATPLRKKGEVLHPERYSAESNIEHKRDPVTWAALFQQDPTAEGAGTVTEELLEKCACVMSDIPKRLVHYNTWDTAVSQNEGSCRSASIVGGLDTNGVLWIVDARQDRMDGLALADEIIAVYRQFKPEVTGIEKTNHAVAMRPFLDRYIEDQRIYDLTITDLEHGNKDKVARARPMQAMMRLGKVRIPTDAPWYEDLKAELLRFPATPNDMADAFFYQGQLLADMAEPPKPKSEPKKSWKDKVGARKRKTKNWRTG